MNCPKCNIEMNPYEYFNIEIDRCPTCLGIWLDKGEYGQILEKEIGKIVDVASLYKASDKDFNSLPGHCYSCDKEMITLKGAADINFEWCITCEAMFFDQGELTILQDFQAD